MPYKMGETCKPNISHVCKSGCVRERRDREIWKEKEVRREENKK
jgi:hypothetical protein